jgi:hypothetical protein
VLFVFRKLGRTRSEEYAVWRENQKSGTGSVGILPAFFRSKSNRLRPDKNVRRLPEWFHSDMLGPKPYAKESGRELAQPRMTIEQSQR